MRYDNCTSSSSCLISTFNEGTFLFKVHWHVNPLNTSKSPGLGRLNLQVLKEPCKELLAPLQYYTENLFEKEELSKEWKDAHVIPIFNFVS